MDAERPPPRATLVPLKERVWAASAQRRILQDELLPLALYRPLVGRTDAAALLADCEAELDAFVADDTAADGERVYCLRWPPLPPAARRLVAACASRYHLQSTSFDEGNRRFVVVYKHPRDAMAPVLRLADFAHGASYYSPPPPPPRAYEPQRKLARRDGPARYELEAEERTLTCDWTKWASFGADDGADDGYECEIAECHEHLLELRFAPPLELVRASAIVGDAAVALRPLPDGYVAVFRSAEQARGLIASGLARAPDGSERDRQVKAGRTWASAHAEGAPCQLLLADPLGGEPLACTARPLSALQRRRLAGGSTGAGASPAPARAGAVPRALQAALRGLGTGSAAGTKRCHGT